MCSNQNRVSRSRIRRPKKNSMDLNPATISLFSIIGTERRPIDHYLTLPKLDTRDDGKNSGRAILVLKNNHNRYMLAFKVKTTSNRLIRIRPARGFLPQDGEVCIDLFYPNIQDISSYKIEHGSDPIMVVSAFYVVEEKIEDIAHTWTEAETVNPALWKKKFTLIVKELDDIGRDRNPIDGDQASAMDLDEGQERDEAMDVDKGVVDESKD